jgi:hypothetical protein
VTNAWQLAARRRRRLLIASSFVIACLPSIVVSALFFSVVDGLFSFIGPAGAVVMLVVAPVAWCTMVLSAFYFYRQDALIILLGLPLVVAPFFVIQFILSACGRAGVCL